MAKSASIMDYNISRWNGVVYGPPGVGKTIMCGASQTKPTFIFDVDNGMTSLRAHIVRNKLKTDLVRVHRVTSFADFQAGVVEIERSKPDIVVLDSATELFRVLKREISDAAGHDTPDQRDWGRVLDVMEEFTVSMRARDAHFIMTAHEWVKQDPSSGLPVARPSFQGRFAEEYSKHFSWIARLESFYKDVAVEGDDKKKEMVVRRRLNFGPSPQIHHKDRSGVMRKFEPPDIDGILDRMMASTTLIGDEVEQIADDSNS